MLFTPSDELLALFQMILAERRSPDEWRQSESDDEFQSPHFVGGYDATEDAFCFSYHDDDTGEWWFQLSLELLALLAGGGKVPLDLRRPD